jgi:MFS family permease
VLRFVLFSLGGEQESLLWMWPGIAIHGICYTLFFITGQIYMDQRVEPAMRGQMQGLLGLVTNGIGALLGTVGLKILHRYTVERGDDWTSYWAILTGFTIICTLWFMRAFEDKKTPPAG